MGRMTIPSNHRAFKFMLSPRKPTTNDKASRSERKDESSAFSLQELNLKREILQKCVSAERYQSATLNDLVSIPSEITDKYRVKKMKEERRTHSEQLKSSRESPELKRVRILKARKKIEDEKNRIQKTELLEDRKRNRMQRRVRARESIIQHHRTVSSLFAKRRKTMELKMKRSVDRPRK